MVQPSGEQASPKTVAPMKLIVVSAIAEKHERDVQYFKRH
jgi:hypothetical protein